MGKRRGTADEPSFGDEAGSEAPTLLPGSMPSWSDATEEQTARADEPDEHATLMDVGRVASAEDATLSEAGLIHGRRLGQLEIDPETEREIPAERFGAYVLLDRIGFGGMAEIRRAYAQSAKGSPRPCVIKRLLPNRAADPNYRAMFEDESRLSLRLAHPNIVRALDAGQVDGVAYITFELIDGWNMKDLLDQRGQLPLSVALDLAIEVARALEYAHGLQGDDGQALHLVHRDVSPENILVSRHGHAKLLDFGIARHRERRFQTQIGVVKGKLLYMAPELMDGSAVDGRCDLFSLALVVAEMISGRATIPPAPVGVLAVPDLEQSLRSQLEATSSPADLIETLVEMTRLEPEARLSSAFEAKSRLMEIRRRLGESIDVRTWLGRDAITEDLPQPSARSGSGLPAPRWPAPPVDSTAAPMTIELDELSEEDQRADTIPPPDFGPPR